MGQTNPERLRNWLLLLCFLCNGFLVNAIQTPDAKIIYEISENLTSIPKHTDCLEKTISSIFRPLDGGLVTVTFSWMNSGALNMQENVLKYFNTLGNWTLQIFTEPPHIEFHSTETCFTDLTKKLPVKWCRRHFVLKRVTNYYIIIIDTLSQLEEKLYSIFNSTTFSPEAKYIIYHYRLHEMNISISEIIPSLHKYLVYTVVFIDYNVKIDKQEVFVFKLKLDGTGMCLEGSKFFSVGSCETRRYSVRLNALLKSRFLKSFKNCTIKGLAMTYEPFVINRTKGVEILLLEAMSEYINATFDLKVTLKSEDWGDKVNGTWGGNFNEIVNSLKIGIGNVGPEADRIEDFDFTYSHLSARLVWVVPIAKYMKKWRVLTIIFKLNVWFVCFGVLMFMTLFLIVLSRMCDDIIYYQDISGSLLTSIQIVIFSCVHRIPKTDQVRIIFLSGLIFSLIMTCVYTSSLINVLTNVVREHQIDNEDEILQSGLEIGGLEEYRERFQNAENDGCADDVCKKYQFYTGENDTAQTWLQKVERGIACTPLPRAFVQYYMVKTNDILGNNSGTMSYLPDASRRIKMFIIDKPINFYSLAIVMKKGNPFRRIFDKFLKKFVEAGLMYTLMSVYDNQFIRLNDLIANSDDGPEQLSMYHLQGPFALFGIGNIISILIFIIELICGRKDMLCYRRKEKNRILWYTKIDPKNKALYIDKKYGDMYGKTYPTFLTEQF
ncbi:hypothetical protein WA026_001341 [Henosepilachna vigintioctopunctata]|uniref:Uncharacterized protein n=1 Tax=Henosepilachna vigintioctopunctata TaxID=420089 RepID=A0AAW1URJ2_9CUCU